MNRRRAFLFNRRVHDDLTGIRPMGACRTDTLPVSNGFDKGKSFAAVCR
jgi:hypothetical protein